MSAPPPPHFNSILYHRWVPPTLTVFCIIDEPPPTLTVFCIIDECPPPHFNSILYHRWVPPPPPTLTVFCIIDECPHFNSANINVPLVADCRVGRNYDWLPACCFLHWLHHHPAARWLPSDDPPIKQVGMCRYAHLWVQGPITKYPHPPQGRSQDWSGVQKVQNN